MSPTSIDEDRDSGEQKSRGHEVVLGGAGLAHDERVALQDDGCSEDREMASAVGAADAPGGEEAQGEEGEVEEQGQRVAVCEQDPGRVEKLRVLGVEPVREYGLR